jgi:nanoRNase/pAp phosphatase (c-di-AMP/oligoRNAs hydrolase)
MVGEPGLYGVSLRSVNGTKDVSKIANQLGGGGHKGASGARFEAEDIDAALEKVKQVIDTLT